MFQKLFPSMKASESYNFFLSYNRSKPRPQRDAAKSYKVITYNSPYRYFLILYIIYSYNFCITIIYNKLNIKQLREKKVITFV